MDPNPTPAAAPEPAGPATYAPTAPHAAHESSAPDATDAQSAAHAPDAAHASNATYALETAPAAHVPSVAHAPYPPSVAHAPDAAYTAHMPYPAHAPYGPPPPPRPLARRLFAPVGALAGVAAAFAYVGTVDPGEPGHYPVCPLLRFTGIYCPGCGGLRSAHAFVHGDLGAALGYNALAVVGYGVFAVVMTLWLIRAIRGIPMRLAISPAWWWVIGAVLGVFTLVRNLPFGSALAP